MRAISMVLLIFGLACGDNIHPDEGYMPDADITGPTGPTGPAGEPAPVVPADIVTDVCDTGNHAFWFGSQLGRDYVFVCGGTLTEKPNGDLHLEGVVQSRSNVHRAFKVSVHFRTVHRTGTPKDPPGCADTADWTYYETVTGTLEGLGEYAGALIKITNTGPDAQRGDGAGIHACGEGLATWFTFETLVQNTACTLPESGHGDINLSVGATCLTD